MIIKKLAVPLINDKILAQAEHCYIATSSITDAGFELIRSRIPAKCKMDIVTSLDGITSPNVMQQIYSRYQGRITLNIFTRNVLHANVYVFYLPFRKAVGFVGSGNLSSEGLKDHEELFWRVSDPKEIESLMSWFTVYFEFALPLTEGLIKEYEAIYPSMKQRLITSQLEKQQMMAAALFNWEGVKFKNQYFKKEDFQIFSTTDAGNDNAVLRLARMEVQSKLAKLQSQLTDQMHAHKIILPSGNVSSIEPKDHDDGSIRSMGISFERNQEHTTTIKIGSLLAGIRQLNVFVQLNMINRTSTKKERAYFGDQIKIETYVTSLFKALTSLGSGYVLEVAGVKRNVDSFQNEQALVDFFKTDFGVHFNMAVEKSFSPGDAAISNENITATLLTELSKLSALLEIL